MRRSHHVSSREIERKFLIKRLPVKILRSRHFPIAQGYLANEPGGRHVRLRKKAKTASLTFKLGRGPAREEDQRYAGPRNAQTFEEIAGGSAAGSQGNRTWFIPGTRPLPARRGKTHLRDPRCRGALANCAPTSRDYSTPGSRWLHKTRRHADLGVGKFHGGVCRVANSGRSNAGARARQRRPLAARSI